MADYSGGGNSSPSGAGAPYGPLKPPKPPPAPPPTPPPAAPGPTPPAPSGGGGGGTGGSGGGSSPPYSGATPPINQILGQDPQYQQLLAFDTAMSNQDLAQMNAQIARQQGYYGSDSDPLSILGRIYNAYQDQNRYISNTLTGHGMIDSGETGFQANRATLSYQQQELDARMKLQDFIDGLQNAYQAQQQQMKFNEMTASWNAINSFLTNNPPVPGAVPPPPDNGGGGGGGGSGDGGGGGGGPTPDQQTQNILNALQRAQQTGGYQSQGGF